ncbi:MAG: peptide deformylase [Cytophagaceae bacterium]|jgi:peptide deformylase|nr:peptide deformylase [Cytophagaceae bacterium]
MIYPVVVYGSPVLRKKAEDINKNYENLPAVISNMWETLHHADGVGLAAPQIGLSIRLFIVDGSVWADDYPELKDFKKTFINANIVEANGETIAQNEGCLSLPTIREEVTRPKRIRITYFDEAFQYHDEVFDDQRARIIQHEYDHIEGKMFVDYLSPLRKRLIKGKLNSVSKGKVNVDYRIKGAF